MDCQPSLARPMQLVYAVNREFTPFAMVSVLSALESQTGRCEIHIVHDGDLQSDDEAKIQYLVEQHHSRVQFHRVPAEFPREFSSRTSWDHTVLFRLALTQILPATLDRVIYLDSDTLVRGPLDELWQVELGASGLGAVAESHPALERLGLPLDSAYLNSGVLVIELEKWRRDRTSERLLERVMQNPERWVFADQDIIAVEFAGNWTRLLPEFNVTHRFFSGPSSLPLPSDHPHIIHFTGQGSKPWQSHRPHPFADEFWRVAQRVREYGFAVPARPQKKQRWYQRGPVALYKAYRGKVRQQRRQHDEDNRQARREWVQRRDREMVMQFAGDMIVRRGPFAGMRYAQAYSHGSTLAPKLLGTYEAELHPILERMLCNDYQTIIDVGGAEGYYAIGCALRWPDAKVFAYELQREARKAIAEMAKKNAVTDRVSVQAECVFGDLYRRRALMICDIEGGEADLLINDHASDALADSDLIVETHDQFRPGVCTRLYEQFTVTHDVTVIDSIVDEVRPEHWSLPELAMLSRQRQSQVLAERRGAPMQWLICQSRVKFPQRAMPALHAA